MNCMAALRISSLIGVLTLLLVDHATADAPEWETTQSGQTSATEAATYRGYAPAVPGMVGALKGGKSATQPVTARTGSLVSSRRTTQFSIRTHIAGVHR